MSRRYWHFHYGLLDSDLLLGPHLRAMEMARAARDLGMEATVVVDDPGSGEREGIRFAARKGFPIPSIAPGDAVVVADAAAVRIPYFLARAGIPFHADCYGLPAPELVQIYRSWTPTHRWVDRARRNLRMQFLSHHAERIYLSHPGQTMMLAGMLFAGGQASDPEIVDTLPRRITLMPMGVPPTSVEGARNPYPPALRNRPVFLWGGGIWAWFDVETLLQAFAEAHRRGSDAALFFLSGKDHSGLEIHRRTVERVWAFARETGLLDRAIFLNEHSAGARDLPGYVEHCRAGVMANPDILEATASWRTRYLDLIAGGRPLIVSGTDPLGERMTAAGAALRTPAGDVSRLADSICALAGDSGLATRMGAASLAMRDELSWNRNLEPFRELLRNPSSFRFTRRPGLHWILRYTLSPHGIRWP